jgi:glycosyltransferase involved in cell wall biosynthesis
VKVVFYTENYVIGGCDRFLVDLIRNLDANVFTACLAGNVNLTFDDWLAERIPSQLPRHTINVSTLPSSRLIRHAEGAFVGGGSHTPKRGAGRELARVGGAALRYAQLGPNYVRLRRLFRRLEPDVVHINNGGYPGGETCRLAAFAARAEGVRGIVHFVHNMAYPPPFPQRTERELDRRIDAATDLWLTAADRATHALHEQRGIRLGRIETVYYGIDVSTNGNTSRRHRDRRTLAVVASFEPRKGHTVLLEALAALKRDGFTTTTLLVGDGPERSAMERKTEALGLSDDVRFLGWRKDVDEILSSQSDLLVLPSLSNECLPYAILEAMSYALPVVSTDVAGIPEQVVDGVTGRVVPPGDPVALEQAIRDVAGAPELAHAMGQRGKERLTAKFSTERMVERMSDIYLRLGAV